MERITETVQNFVFLSIFDRLFKLSLQMIFKLIQTVKDIISNNNQMLYKLRVF
jgi:hypothetical protein